MRIPFNSTQGSMLVEILLAISLMGILMPVLIGSIITSRQGKTLNRDRNQALLLVKEAEEAVRNIRNNGWTTFSTNGSYRIDATGGSWTLVSSATGETIGNFTRMITISDTRRSPNLNGSINPSGIIDPSTKTITTTVTWGSPIPASITSTMYLTRHDNDIYIETTKAQFDAGTFVGTASTNSSGGEVILGSGGSGDWCEPSLTLATQDIEGSGVANAVTALPGHILVGTGNNAAGISIANVDVDIDSDPPATNVAGKVDGYKVNSIFNTPNYAFITTDTNDSEVVIFDLNQQSGGQYVRVGKFNPVPNSDGAGIFVSGNIGFMTEGTTLRTFDVTTMKGPTTSQDQLASISLPGTGTSITVVGSYAYISISGNAKKLQVVQFSPDGRTLTNAGYYSNSSAGNGMDVAINSTGTRAYLAASATTTKELFIINTEGKSSSNPSLPAVGPGFEANGMSPKGIGIATGNRAILVGIGGNEYQVIDITDESSPIICGFENIDSGVHGVATVIEPDEDAYSYIITGDAASELKIIEGGPGGGFASEGTFESDPYTVGYQLAFNRFFASVATPSQTSISFHVAVASPADNNCTTATYDFIGPDGTSGTFFTGSGETIPLISSGNYQNPGLCFKYKAYFETADSTVSPILYEVSINRSP